MVKQIVLIVGMPGSGKTELGNELIEKLDNSVFFDTL